MSNKSNLEITEDFDCGKEKLYNAWTDPKQLKQWWKPMDRQLTNVTNEIKEGGKVSYVFDDNSLAIEGQYEKVVDHELLEYTWNWHISTEEVEDAHYKLKVHFGGDDQSATLSIIQEGFNTQDSIHPHEQGWRNALQQLKAFVSGDTSQQQSNEGSATQQHSDDGTAQPQEGAPQKPPVSGYNETPEQAKVGGG